MPATTPTPSDPPADAAPTAAPPTFAAAWATWIAVGGAVLLAAAALALATGQTALGDALDVGRWFR
ncbi:MAG: hypothetical protein JNM10_11705 [Planctomycetia bacterium]|nr:hypothetical protein [Planctomycetia bacterium]